MNIFLLDESPRYAAKYHVDRHIVKMPLELSQMLSSAHRVLDGTEYTDKSKSGRNVKRWHLLDERNKVLYNASFINHPCTRWVRESADNYLFTLELLKELQNEYTHRYDKHHATERLIATLSTVPYNIPNKGFSNPAQAMPVDVQKEYFVDAYRMYYIYYKNHLASWKRRGVPFWWQDIGEVA